MTGDLTRTDVQPFHKAPRLSKRKRTERAWAAKKAQLDESREVVKARADGWCEARIEGVCLGVGDAAHHIKTRAAGGGHEPENLLWVCNAGCHAHIHRFNDWARAEGLLRGRYS